MPTADSTRSTDNAANADSTRDTDRTVTLDRRVRARNGVTLVAVVVENPAATPRRIRVANRLDGPVRPPRREGVPETGWDDGGFEGVVAAGATRPLGYACPAPPAEPPAELVWTEPAGETEHSRGPDHGGATEDVAVSAREATPVSVVRALGTARPPADAVPTPDRAERSDLPDAVASWLAGVEERAARGDGGDPTPDDHAALAVVAERVEALREGGTDPATTRDAGKSPDARRSP